MNKSSKHFILSIITTLLVALPTLIGFGTKAHADVSSCLGGILLGNTEGTIVSATAQGTAEGAAGTGEGAALAGQVTSVPVADSGVVAMIQAQIQALAAFARANDKINIRTSSNVTGSTIQRCIVEPLVTIMARSILENFTAQTVQWINSGFQGSPQYVTNIQGFFADVGDQAAGQFIAGLGPVGQMLCSPFDLQLRLSLGLQYSSNYRQLIGCRLSDIQNNVQRAFTNGQFGDRGWDNWLQLTTVPQNNPYGAYLKAVEAMDIRIGNAQYSLGKELDFGKGFLSSKDPVTNKITTPGSLIEDQLSETLGQPIRNLGVAKDLDAILNALVGQMIGQVMGGLGGLAGAGNSSSGGGQSAIDRGINQTVQAIVLENSRSTILPIGFVMNTGPTTVLRPTGDVQGPSASEFCYQFSRNIYGTRTGSPDIYVKVNGTGDEVPTSKVPSSGIPTVPWTIADYNSVSTFCRNSSYTTALSSGTSAFTTAAGTPVDTSGIDTTVATNPVITTPNLAQLPGVTARQSSTYTGTNWSYPEASIAIDGQVRAFSNYGLSLTQDAPDQWWQVDLGAVKPVGSIKIYRVPDGSYFNQPFHVFVTTTDPGEVGLNSVLFNSPANNVVYHNYVLRPDSSSYFGTTGNNFATINLGNVSGRYIRIARSISGSMGLAEVEAYAPATNGSGVAQSPAVSFSTPETTLSRTYSRNMNLTYSTILTVARDISGFQTQLTLVRADYTTQTFPVMFSNFNVSETNAGLEIKNVDIVQENCLGGRYFARCNPRINPIFNGKPQNPVTYDESLSARGGTQIRFAIDGDLREFPTPGSYKLILEILDGSGVVIATQTTTFTIQ